MIAFVGLIVAQVEWDNNKEGDRPNRYMWWSIIFGLFLNLGVFVVVASDTIHTYHVALTGYCSAGMILHTTAVNSLIHADNPARQASAAGFVLLSMITVRAHAF